MLWGRLHLDAEAIARTNSKTVQYTFEALTGKLEDVAVVAGRVEEISGRMDQSQRMIQQDSSTTITFLLLHHRTLTDQVVTAVNAR